MDNGGKKNAAKLTALGGVLLAMTEVCLYLASFVPGFEMTLYAVSSLLAAVMMIESRGKGGWLLYSAASLISLMILPNKLGAVPYILFFGLYPVLKSYIERLKNTKLQLAVKFASFTVLMLILYRLAAGLLFSGTLFENAPFMLIVAGGEVFFLIYDMILSWLIGYYYRRFYGKI